MIIRFASSAAPYASSPRDDRASGCVTGLCQMVDAVLSSLFLLGLEADVALTHRDSKNGFKRIVQVGANRLAGASPWTRKGAVLRRERKA